MAVKKFEIKRIVKEFLPYKLRTNTIFAYITVLLHNVIIRNQQFNFQTNEIKSKMSHTSQKIVLEHYLNKYVNSQHYIYLEHTYFVDTFYVWHSSYKKEEKWYVYKEDESSKDNQYHIYNRDKINREGGEDVDFFVYLHTDDYNNEDIYNYTEFLVEKYRFVSKTYKIKEY